MLTFTRAKSVSIEGIGPNFVICHCSLDDYIYSMTLEITVNLSRLTIENIEGKMKRITTSLCKTAEPQLKKVIGLNLLDAEFEFKIKRLVGRQGCRHFADMIMEAASSILDLVTYDDALKIGKRDAVLRNCLIDNNPRLKDSCLIYSL